MLSIMQLSFFVLQITFLLLLSLNSLVAVNGKMQNNGNHGGQRFAMEPQDQTAIVGSRVTLPCRVVDKKGVLQWTKDDFGLGAHRNLSGFDRYSMVGSDEEGDFSLDIYPVMLDDDSRFQCQVSPGRNGIPGIRSRFAQLTILVPPDNPKIIQGSHMVTTEDREIELECISYGGKPAAEITWIDGLGNVISKGIQYSKHLIENSKLFVAKSILKFTPKKEHHNTTFTCQAQNTADRTYKSAKFRLEVKFAPKVSITVAGGALAGGRIQEGTEVRLNCHAEANPPEVTYRWYIDDEKVIGDHTTELIIQNVSRELHDSIVKCEVHNIVGKSEESEILDISYGPSFKTRPSSVEADIGSTVTLNCDVDGNPIPEIVWIFETLDRRMQVVGTHPNLTVEVAPETAGRYYCKATVMGFPEIGAEATIFLKGPPSITSTKRQYGTPGDVSKIECIAFSIPKARHVSWSFNGHELNASSDDDFKITEHHVQFGIKSTLTIRESDTKHFGRYNCTVLNDYGYDIMEIELTGENHSHLFFIMFGSAVCFIFFIMVLSTCIMCRKQGKKKLPPADVITDHHLSKGCKESDCSSNKSDIKINRENEYLETCSGDLSQTRIPMNTFGVSLNGGIPDFRYSGDFTDSFQTSKLGIHNNGYVPYVDYNRDYIPPPQSLTLNNRTNHTSLTNHLIVSTSSSTLTAAPVITSASIVGISNGPLTNNTYSLNRIRHNMKQDNGLPIVPTSLSSIQNGGMNQSLLNVDPRYSATYGNPYLKNSNTSIFPPNTAHPAITPAPPPYNASRGSNSNSSFSSSTTISNVNGGGSIVGIGGGGLTTTTSNAGSSPPLTQPSQTPSPSSGHITLPSNAKLGGLATHV